MNWIILAIAGLFEIGRAIGTVILGIVLLGEPADTLRITSPVLIVAGIIGLKPATPA